MDIHSSLAHRVTSLKASAIREIFKLLGKPGIISFAGGIPSPELFPTDVWGDLLKEIIDTEGSKALVYGVTEGYAPLVEIVGGINSKNGVGKDFDRTIITTGAQQAIDLLVKSMVNEGEGVICEDPSFIGSLNAIRSYNAELFGVEMDEEGICTDKVEEILKKENIKLIYTIPTFQNPTGITQSLSRRKKLLELAEILSGIDTDSYSYTIEHKSHTTDRDVRCRSPFNHMHITWNGNVLFCTDFYDFKAGNVKDASIEDIFFGQMSERYREEIENGRCVSCNHCSWRSKDTF